MKIKRVPDPSEYDDEDDFMNDCVAQLENDDADDPEGECAIIWDERNLSAAQQKNNGGIIYKRAPEQPSVDTLEYVLSDSSKDRMGDIIEVNGWDIKNFKRNPIALFNHNSDAPIGTWKDIRIEKNALRATLSFAEQGTSPRIDELRALVKQGILRGVSVGFKPIKSEPLDEDDPFFGGQRFTKQELVETSLVAIPANPNALQQMKSLGISDETIKMVFRRTRPKAAGATKLQPTTPKAVVVKSGSTAMARKSIAEQISGFEATRAAKAARMEEMMEEAGEKGETFDQSQQDEYDGLETEIKSVDAHLNRLRSLEKINISKAVEVNGKSADDASISRGGDQQRSSIIQVRHKQVEKGAGFTRYVIALARAQGNLMQAHHIALSNEQWMAETPEVEQVLKAAVAAGTTTDPAWAGPLVQYQNLSSEFAELLRPATIIGRLGGLTRVPFKVKIPAQTGGATVGWVGEGKAKPLSALAFTTITMDFSKIAGIIPLTEELVRFSSPSAEALVRSDLAAAIVQFMDRQFVDPAVAATAVNPASITNGITGATPSGTDATALKNDLAALTAGFLTSNLSVASAAYLMTQAQAMRIGMMQNTLGQPIFPGVTMTGGTLNGIPVVASENLPGSAGTGYPIILLLQSEILLADDGTTTIDASREASLQMDSAPDSPPTATTVLVSLWQNNMVAIKAERFINWRRRRDSAVAWINNAKYA